MTDIAMFVSVDFADILTVSFSNYIGPTLDIAIRGAARSTPAMSALASPRRKRKTSAYRMPRLAQEGRFSQAVYAITEHENELSY